MQVLKAVFVPGVSKVAYIDSKGLVRLFKGSMNAYLLYLSCTCVCGVGGADEVNISTKGLIF